jgi:L-alanine-DL-glutamate epimerase-like enolase superfamily enzyme
MKIVDWTLYTPDENFHVFLEVHTDAGLSGWGSAYSAKQQVVGALDWLKRFLVGENPLEIERVTEKLHEITFWIGRGGAMTHAISAINLALWDIAGQAFQQPVHLLLGGRLRAKVPTYGSILFRPVETLTDRIYRMRERGFRAMKLGWNPFFRGSLADDERLVRQAREAAGDDVTLLIDAGGSDPYWSARFKDALQRAKMLADYEVYWFEDPLPPDDIEGYVLLTQQSPIKIAHGEVLTRRQSFIPYFSRRAMDIVQPDATKVGGLSEMRRIAWFAQAHGIELVPHGWNTAVGVAADIHLVSTLPEHSFVEFNVGNPLVEDILETPFQLDSTGCLAVPDGPGLGIHIDRDRLKRFEESRFASETWAWDTNHEYDASTHCTE